MGVVFEAVHSVSQRPVAIKLLPWRFAADMSVWTERLQREATTIAALQHPNIVPIYSFAEDQGYYFYVMQLIDGVGLDKTIQRLQHLRYAQGSSRRRLLAASAPELTLTPDSWRGFARIGEQVALALSYAHQQSILHNDIKPSNLLIRVNGQVIVTDFGIGRMLPNNLSEADEHAVGTLKYMAPERLTEGGRAESDVYSLGATLYELVTQTSIFDMGKRPQLVNAILHQAPLPPRACNPEIPRSLESIILKAIAKVPADRYATAREMAIDLRRFINRQPIQATRRGLWQRAVDWYQKRTISWRR